MDLDLVHLFEQSDTNGQASARQAFTFRSILSVPQPGKSFENDYKSSPLSHQADSGGLLSLSEIRMDPDKKLEPSDTLGTACTESFEWILTEKRRF